MITSTATYSEIEDRLDAEFYKPSFLKIENALRQLPITKHLNDVAVSERKRRNPAQESTGTFHYLDIANVDLITGEVSLQEITKGEAPSRARRGVNINDVVISTVRPNRNAVSFIDENLKDVVCSTGFAVVKPKQINPHYLFAFLKSNFAVNQLVRRTSAAMYPAVSESEVLNIKIPVPSESTQEKIGSIIKKCFKQRQLAKQKYEEARQLLNDFLGITEDEFVFENTFSLPFSEMEDRLDCGYYQPLELLELQLFKDGIIPLGDLAKIAAGKTPAKHEYTKEGVRILKVRDLTNQGINWKEGNRSYANSGTWEKTKRARVQENDLLLISAAHQAHYIGQEIDVVFDIPKEHDEKLLAVAELLVVRVNKINPYVLLWYLRSKVAYLLIQRLITGETSHLYAKDLVNLPIPEKLLKFKNSEKVERLTRESLLLKKESKQLLEQAKEEVEKIIS